MRCIVLFVIPLAFGFISLLLGKDMNWDLKNYHYYNAHAFIEHRMDFDIAPAQLQTYINPIADIPFYWMTKFFPDWVSGLVIGFIHGLNLSFVFLIFWLLSKESDTRRKLITGICLAVVSGIAPGFISELGNTMHDNLTSLFVLCALYLLLKATHVLKQSQPNTAWKHIGLAGLTMGIGVGIKPSIIIFAMSTALIFTLLQPSWRNKLASLLIYGISGATGGLISAGFWWWEMWKRFQNPLFPFYNHIFKSSYFTATKINWSVFLPDRIWEYFVWPLIFTSNSLRVNQFRFLDIRFALLYILFLIWTVLFITRKIRPASSPSRNITHLFDTGLSIYFLTFFALSCILWIRESATYRFLIPLELLAPLCFLILLEDVIPSQKTQMNMAIAAAILTLFVFRPFSWGRQTWSGSYFSVDTTQFDTSADAVVIMLGRSPTSYIIPEFPSTYRFIRPEGNLFTFADEKGNLHPREDTQLRFLKLSEDILDLHTGLLYILYNTDETNIQPAESLLRLGITPNITDCFLLKINTPDKLEICRVEK